MAKNRRVRGTDPRKAYNALAKYFGLRARDAFLDPLKPSGDPKPDSKKETAEEKLDKYSVFTDMLFSQGHTFDTLEELDKTLKDSGDQKEKISSNVSVTTFEGTKFVDFYNKSKSDSDQGWGQAADKGFTLKALYENGLTLPTGCDIAAIQIFPVATGIDIADTEISSLFLNSLSTINMSRAIPYMDVRVINSAKVDKDTGNFESDPDFSLGKFLGGSGKNDGLRGKFDATDPEAGNVGGLSAVAGMEVFTTPQTLVDRRESTRYSREAGGRIDAFRPFMGIESLEITDQFTGAGSISYKSAEMSIKLFDKGRLSEISELVTPRRSGNLRFEITYGWSHPDGDHIGRASDADASTRLGRLIDSMRVTEIYRVGNSNFTIETDGTVSINMQLFMESAASMSSRDITSLNISSTNKLGGITLTDLARELEDIKNQLLEAAGQPKRKITLPGFVQAMDVNSALAIDKDALKEFRGFIEDVKNTNGSLAALGAKLYRIFNNGSKASDLTKLRKGRKEIAKSICDEFRRTPDPFLRPSKGVERTALAKSKGFKALNQLDTASKATPQRYVSYGKVMTKFLGDALTFDKTNTEIQIIFGACNHNAAGVFDHNIAQIPIQIEDFQSRLGNLLAGRPHVSVEFFVRFMNDEFISFDGLAAYGLSEIIQPNARDDEGGAKFNKKKKKIIESALEGSPGAILRKQAIEEKMLNRIYGEGRRVNPTFTKPQFSARIVTKKAKTDDKKDVTRVYIQDVAAGRLMTVADALMSLVSDGSTIYQDYSSGDPKFRGARHNEIYAKNFGELVEKGIVGDLSQEAKDGAKKALTEEGVTDDNTKRVLEKLEKTKVLKKLPASLRAFFFEKSPYLLYGTAGSGIIEASLTSEANDNLTTIFLSKRGSSGEQTAPEKPLNLPFRVHPTNLNITTFGCPLLRLMQKYFIDMGTNTTADNYYNIVGLSHTFEEGNYTTSAALKPYDAYGSFENVGTLTDTVFIKSVVAEEKRRAAEATRLAAEKAAAGRKSKLRKLNAERKKAGLTTFKTYAEAKKKGAIK